MLILMGLNAPREYIEKVKDMFHQKKLSIL